MKVCTKCGVAKESTCFGNLSASKDGLREVCKACKKISDDLYRKAHPELNRKKVIAYYYRNKERLNAKRVWYMKQYRAEKKEELAAKKKEYRKKNALKLKEKKHQYYLKRKEAMGLEALNKQSYKWREENREKALFHQRERAKKYTAELRSYYVKSNAMAKHGFTKEQLENPDIIEARKIIIKIKRHVKEKTPKH